MLLAKKLMLECHKLNGYVMDLKGMASIILTREELLLIRIARTTFYCKLPVWIRMHWEIFKFVSGTL